MICTYRFAAAFLVFFISVSAQAQSTCVPKCRSGFTCHDGQCISKCNPPCNSGEKCTAAGECVGPKTAKREAPATATPGDSGTMPGVSVGVMAGVTFPGVIYSDPPDEDLDTTSGLVVRAILDNPVTKTFSAGLYLNYISSTAELGSLSSDFCRHRHRGCLQDQHRAVAGYGPEIGLGRWISDVGGR